MERSTIRPVHEYRHISGVARLNPWPLLALILALVAIKPASAQVFATADFQRNGRNVSMKICNGNPLCTRPVLVGIATYRDPDVSFDSYGMPLPPTWNQLIKQTLYDCQQAWVNPGCCVTVKCKSPKQKDCKYFQVDCFTGCVIKCFAKEGDYGDRLLKGAIYKCHDDKGKGNKDNDEDDCDGCKDCNCQDCGCKDCNCQDGCKDCNCQDCGCKED